MKTHMLSARSRNGYHSGRDCLRKLAQIRSCRHRLLSPGTLLCKAWPQVLAERLALPYFDGSGAVIATVVLDQDERGTGPGIGDDQCPAEPGEPGPATESGRPGAAVGVGQDQVRQLGSSCDCPWHR
jgi:hypothetical protein